VLALVNTDTGEVRSWIIPDVTGPTLAKAIAEQVDVTNSNPHTDEHKGYRPLAKDFQPHSRTNHTAHQYVDRETGSTTTPAESFSSQLKRSIDRTHHHVSREHLHRYLAQHDFLRTWC
jgi:hypothetical protein